jgi:hypothetical protein
MSSRCYIIDSEDEEWCGELPVQRSVSVRNHIGYTDASTSTNSEAVNVGIIASATVSIGHLKFNILSGHDRMRPHIIRREYECNYYMRLCDSGRLGPSYALINLTEYELQSYWIAFVNVHVMAMQKIMVNCASIVWRPEGIERNYFQGSIAGDSLCIMVSVPSVDGLGEIQIANEKGITLSGARQSDVKMLHTLMFDERIRWHIEMYGPVNRIIHNVFILVSYGRVL